MFKKIIKQHYDIARGDSLLTVMLILTNLLNKTAFKIMSNLNLPKNNQHKKI